MGAMKRAEELLGADDVLIGSTVNAFGTEHRQLPGVRSLIVAHEISIAVGTSQFEVPVLGCQPRIEHFRDSDATVTKNQRAGRLLSAVASVALHTNREWGLVLHQIITASVSSN
jgi:hypothetical protein